MDDNEYGTARAAFDRWCVAQGLSAPDVELAWRAWQAGVNHGAEAIADLQTKAAADLLELERIGPVRRPTPRTP